MIERRRYPRFELKINAKYRIMDSEQALRFINVKNISAEGMCFESDKRLKPSNHVKLEVDLGDRGNPVSFTGDQRAQGWREEIYEWNKINRYL